MAKKVTTTAKEPDSSEIVPVSFLWITYFGIMVLKKIVGNI